MLKNIVNSTLKMASLINRERDSEITTEVRTTYFGLINKYIASIILGTNYEDEKNTSLN